jgi:hypothetical protein
MEPERHVVGRSLDSEAEARDQIVGRHASIIDEDARLRDYAIHLEPLG